MVIEVTRSDFIPNLQERRINNGMIFTKISLNTTERSWYDLSSKKKDKKIIL